MNIRLLKLTTTQIDNIKRAIALTSGYAGCKGSWSAEGFAYTRAKKGGKEEHRHNKFTQALTRANARKDWKRRAKEHAVAGRSLKTIEKLALARGVKLGSVRVIYSDTKRLLKA